MYICVEGNIGAGKTTFVNHFAEQTGFTPIYERFSENPFLELFYKNPSAHAFPLEMSFLAERFQQLNELFSKPDLFTQNYISDYSFFKTLIFAKQNLSPEEFEVFQTFHGMLSKLIPKPTCYIYLDTSNDQSLENIIERGRSMEQKISLAYLERVNNSYKSLLLRSNESPTIIIPYGKNEWKNTKSIINEVVTKIDSDYLNPGAQLLNK